MEFTRKRKWIAAGIAVIVIAAIATPLLLMNPQKTQVRYGTLIVDAEGNIIADDTRTAMVPISEADDYHLEIITEGGEVAETTDVQTNQPITDVGPDYANIAIPVTSDMKESMVALVEQINAMNETMVSALDLMNIIDSLQGTLAETRDQIAAIPVPPEMESRKQTILQAYDLYIQALGMYPEDINGANALIQQANALIESLAS